MLLSSSCAVGVAEQLLDRHQQRRVADEFELVVDAVRELGSSLEPVFGLGLGDGALEPLHGGPSCLLTEQGHGGVDIEPGVPDVQVSFAGEASDRLAVRAGCGRHDRATFGLVEVDAASRDLEAGGQPLDIPIERAGVRFVEVVDVEQRGSGPAPRSPRSSTGARRHTAEHRGPHVVSPPGLRPWATPRPGSTRTARTPSARNG